MATVVLEGAELVEEPRRILLDLPGLLVGPDDELLGVVDHVLEHVHHLPNRRARIAVRGDVVGDALTLVGTFEGEFECGSSVTERDTAEREEVREEAHRVVELLVERARVLAHRPLDVLGRLPNLQGVQPERPADSDPLGIERFGDAGPVVQRLEDDADPVLALLDGADEVLLRTERLPRPRVADGEHRVAVVPGERVDDDRTLVVLVNPELDAALLEDRRVVRRGQ